MYKSILKNERKLITKCNELMTFLVSFISIYNILYIIFLNHFENFVYIKILIAHY